MEKKIQKFYLFIVSLIFIVGLICVIIKLPIKTYHLLTQKKLIATVECVESNEYKSALLPQSPKSVKNPKIRFLQVNILSEGNSERKEKYVFNANEWIIEARLIKYKLWPRLLGVKTYYKLERIGGRYFDINDEKNKPRIVYELSSGSGDFWFFIYKYQKFMPFIEAAYGSSAFVPFTAGRKFGVYITDSGLMIKELTD